MVKKYLILLGSGHFLTEYRYIIISHWEIIMVRVTIRRGFK